MHTRSSEPPLRAQFCITCSSGSPCVVQAPEDGTRGQREAVDWQPVLAAMALSPKQKRAAHDARLALGDLASCWAAHIDSHIHPCQCQSHWSTFHSAGLRVMIYRYPYLMPSEITLYCWHD